MTREREEAIKYLESIKPYVGKNIKNAIDMAIEALKQETIVDEIREELIQCIQNGTLKIMSGNEELFRVIDKYKTESEEIKI